MPANVKKEAILPKNTLNARAAWLVSKTHATKVIELTLDLMPDVLHWLGITKIDNYLSMSNMKYDAIVESGIRVINRFFFEIA